MDGDLSWLSTMITKKFAVIPTRSNKNSRTWKTIGGMSHIRLSLVSELPIHTRDCSNTPEDRIMRDTIRMISSSESDIFETFEFGKHTNALSL